MTQMTLPQIAQLTLGIKSTEVKQIQISKMTSGELEIANMLSQQRACFDNAYRFLEYTGATYVLGYVNVGFPIEHAFIKLDNKYIDPTYEVFGIQAQEYYSFLEIPLHDMFDIVTEVADYTNDIPRAPMLAGLRCHPSYKSKFLDSRTQMKLLTEHDEFRWIN